MADELDAMLQGQDQPLATPAQTQGQGDDSTQSQTIEQQTPEEVEFNSLSGSTQDRIRKLAADKRDLSSRLENLERQVGTQNYVPPAPGSNYRTPEVDDAIRKLSDIGIATDDKVNKTVDEKFNQIRWEFEQNRLESKYSGSSGEPQYVREEVEDFIQSHPQYRGYAAEDVFKTKMFPDEFLNVELAKRGSKTGRSSTLKPTKAQTQSEGMTPEYIEQRLQQPDGREWYDEHLTEINATLKQMQPQQ